MVINEIIAITIVNGYHSTFHTNIAKHHADGQLVSTGTVFVVVCSMIATLAHGNVSTGHFPGAAWL